MQAVVRSQSRWVVIGALAMREMRDALRTRWFALYSLALMVLAGGLTYISTVYSGYAGLQGFSRAAAGLVNLMLLVVPLMGLIAGALTLAGERERKTLGYMMSQPISAGEFFCGKVAGLGAALATSLLLSFGVVAVLLGSRGAPLNAVAFAGFSGLTVLLAMVGLGFGVLISSAASRVAQAQGVSLFVWFVLVFLGDLGVMGSVLVTRMRVESLLLWSLLNPLQVYRLATVAVLSPRLEVLGPAGLYVMSVLGTALVPLLVGLLVAWVIVPLVLAFWIFRRGDMA